MKALLLVGSPRRAQSASETLGGYLLQQLEHGGTDVETLYIYTLLKTEEQHAAAIKRVAQADLVLVTAPLYVDSLPASVIRFLELLAAELPHHSRPERQQFAALSNCGFPEATHNEVALAIYRRFAQETGFVWAGGLALGAGEMIKGRPLDPKNGMARNLVTGLDTAAAALLTGDPIPAEARALLAKPFIPPWMYRAIGQLNWRRQARKNGIPGQLRNRPW